MSKWNERLVMSWFYIDGDHDERLRGFTDGSHWNGWANPKCLKPDLESYLNECGIEYKFEGDDLIITFEGQEPDTFNSAIYDTARLGKVRLYDMNGLIWDDIREDEPYISG